MKNIFKILTVTAAAALVLGACKEDKLMIYEGDNNVYFQHKKWPSGTRGYYAKLLYNGTTFNGDTGKKSDAALDSLEVTMAFVNTVIPVDTTFLPILLMGDVVDYDRKIGYKIVNTDDPNAGEEGVDFRVLDAFIPANKTLGGIVVEMIRARLGGDKYFVVDFQLVDNDDFKVRYDSIPRSATDKDKVAVYTMRLKFTDGLTQPQWYVSTMAPYTGKWSSKKAYVMHDELGVSWDTLYGRTDVTISASIGYMLKRYLDEYEKEHGKKLLEDNGDPMEVGPMVGF